MDSESLSLRGVSSQERPMISYVTLHKPVHVADIVCLFAVVGCFCFVFLFFVFCYLLLLLSKQQSYFVCSTIHLY